MTTAEDPRVLAAAHAMYRQAMRLERLPDEVAEHHWNLPPEFNSDRPYYCRLALQVLEAADAAATKPEPMTIERLNELDLLALPSAAATAEDLRTALSEALMAVWTLRELLADSRQAADTYLDQLQRAEKPDRG